MHLRHIQLRRAAILLTIGVLDVVVEDGDVELV